MNILILTGKFGMGHNSAAHALREEIEKKYDNQEINIKTIDICKYLLPKAHKPIYKGFGIIANKYQHLYNFSYNLLDERINIDIPLKKLIMKNIQLLIEGYKADIIISTLPLSSKLISTYKTYYSCDIPLITCITDVSTHTEWINPNTDIYFVATQGTKTELISKGINRKNIYVSGVPVKSGFKQDMDFVNLDKNKNLLIMGGGLGLLPKSNEFYERINSLKNIKTTIITGNNKTAYKRLHGKYKNIEVVGYTNRVSQYMKRADLLISKPGGVTLFETIHSELPILVLEPTLSQEILNAHYIEEQGIGRVLWNSDDNLIDEIDKLMCNELLMDGFKSSMIDIKDNLEDDVSLKAIRNIQMKGMAS